MERVSIRFDAGKLEIRDDEGNPVDTRRATVFLVQGNEWPVALIEVAGTVTTAAARYEVPVSSLEVTSAAAVVTDDTVQPRRHR